MQIQFLIVRWENDMLRRRVKNWFLNYVHGRGLDRAARRAEEEGEWEKAAELWVQYGDAVGRHPTRIPPYREYEAAVRLFAKAGAWQRCIETFRSKELSVATQDPTVVSRVIDAYLHTRGYSDAFRMLDAYLQENLDRGFDAPDWAWARMLEVANAALKDHEKDVLWPKKLCDRLVEVYHAGIYDELSVTGLVDYLERANEADLALAMRGWRP